MIHAGRPWKRKVCPVTYKNSQRSLLYRTMIVRRTGNVAEQRKSSMAIGDRRPNV